MPRILFYTDLHLADQTPRSRTGDYKTDILKKLREIVDLAIQNRVDYLVNGADTFDRKSPWRVSHRLVRETIEIMRHATMQHLTVVGTHDVPTGRLDKLSQQPLGILQEAQVIEVIGDPVTSPVGDHGALVFHAVPASYDLDKDPTNYAVHGDYGKPVITVAHGMIVPPGRTFFGDYTDADTIETGADLVLYGHPHTPDGIYRNKFGTTFVGPGSVSRRDSSPYNRARTPCVVLIELGEATEPKFKTIELTSARPGSEVFADLIADEQDENERDARVQEFAEALRTTNIADDQWGRDQLLEEIRNSDASPEVRKRAEEILESVSS